MLAEDLTVSLTRPAGGRGVPYHRQIYGQIRQSILDGQLRPGDRLPSTRDLAAKLGLARNTVARAYADLLAEGYLAGKVGSGTYVATGLGADRPASAGRGAGRASVAPSGLPSRTLADWAARLVREPASVDRVSPPRIDFRLGTPDWSAFPRRLWMQVLGRAVRREAEELGRYGAPAGYAPLRAAIARHLALSRGVNAIADQVVIVNGSQQALDILTRIWVRPGDQVVVEDPGYPDARQAFAVAGARAVPVPVDPDGIDVERLRADQAANGARLIYVTPSHQFPTGATLSLARRLALLEWASQRDVLVVEDDYDSEFHYSGRPVESLQGLDRAGRVVYVGTFSTVLFPPLRVGYVVLPPDLVNVFQRAKWLADRQTPTLEQIALAEFLAEGHFGRHLRRMRRLAAERREALLAAIGERFGLAASAIGGNSGMHVRLPLPTAPGLSAIERELAVVRAAAKRGVGVYPVGPCCIRPPERASLLLGYAAVSVEQIREGVGVLAEVVTSPPRSPSPRSGEGEGPQARG